MLIYLAFGIGLVVGVAFNEWHSNWKRPRDPDIHVIMRKFEYGSYQLTAYNSAREALENNSDKFQLLKIKCTGSAVFEKYGIFIKYRSLHGHTLKFNYDLTRFDVVEPPKVNEL